MSGSVRRVRSHLLADLLEQHQRRVRFLPAPGDGYRGIPRLSARAMFTVPVRAAVSFAAAQKLLLRPQLLDVLRLRRGLVAAQHAQHEPQHARRAVREPPALHLHEQAQRLRGGWCQLMVGLGTELWLRSGLGLGYGSASGLGFR